MAESKIFKLPDNLSIVSIVDEIVDFLRRDKDMTPEVVENGDAFFIQASDESGLKKLAGLSKSIQIQLVPNDMDRVIVTIDHGKLVDKAAAGAVGFFLFTPLAVTAAMGAYGQNKLIGEIFDCIERFIVSGGQTVWRRV